MELILNTYGTSLNRENDGFVVSKDGTRQRIPAEGITSIQISRGAQITSDAVLLAVEREIEVIFTTNDGSPMGRIWSPKYGSISTIRKGQVNFSFSHDAVGWIKEIIRKKIENQQALVMLFTPDDDAMRSLVTKSVNRLEDYRNKITNLQGDIVADVAAQLRGWEGLASKIYFETLNRFIPASLSFAQRTQHPAMDPVNALLNYGYGLLYGKVEGALIKAGIDPYIGIMHRDNYNRPVLVYDIIEIYRIWIDYVVFSLAAQNAITDEYFSVKDDGSHWLEPLGRRVLIQSVNDYLEDVVAQNGIARSRKTQIDLYAQALAQKFKQFE